MRVDAHKSLAPIREAWDRMVPRDRVVLESAHLQAIERSGINAIEPYYLLAHERERLAGAAYCFAMRLDLASIEKEVPKDALAALRSWNPGFMDARILECGVVSGLGSGIAASPSDLGDVCRAVAAEMERIARDVGAEFVLVRDIPHGQMDNYQAFIEEGYAPLMGFPIAMMTVRADSFESYLDLLKCATRRHVRRFLSRQPPGLEVEVIRDFGIHAERLAELWRNTHARADDYSHEVLTPDYFREMARSLPERSHIVALRRNGAIVAFSLSLLGDEEYFSVHAGIDYASGGEDDNLYLRLSLAILDDAFARKPKRINWGISTYDFKFERGFEAEPMVYFVKHVAQPRLTVALARGLQAAIKQPENLHRPFRDQDVTKRPDLKALAAELPVVTPPAPSQDVFSKVYAYDRTDSLKVAGIYSFFPPFESAQGPTVQFQGHEVVMLGSNAYLGLAAHPKLVAAAKAAIDKYGTGCSGSPLLNGTLDIHLDLTRALAAFMQKEDAILCSTGYQTNLGVVSALLVKDDVVVMDQFDHASLVDGARLAAAQIVRFRHNDMDSLEDALRAHPDRGKLVVVDSVFSMEGTVADLPSIVALARKYGARTMVDEAHAIGVLGPGGRGGAELLGVLDQVDVVMGTFSKSFASIGGFVAGNAKVIDYLRHVARSHMFSASLPPSAVATVGAALEIIKSEPERRRSLLRNAAYMARGLQALGYDAKYHQTAIVPVHCGSDAMALGAYKRLLDKGLFVNPVLYPAVPKGRELLRTSYMATHTQEMLDRALGVFAEARTPSFPSAAAPRPRTSRAALPSLHVRPLVLLPLADRHSLAHFYAVASRHSVLRIPGFTRLELGQPIDCGISFGQEHVKLQYPGVVAGRCLAPQPGRPLGIDVELLQSPDGTRDLIERLLEGEVIPREGRHSWRYHAEIGVEWALDAEPQLDTLEDISLEGAAIRSLRNPAQGSRLPLQLRTAQGAPIEVGAEVRWLRKGEHPAFGVRFRFSDAQERERVRGLVERIQASIADPSAVSAAIH